MSCRQAAAADGKTDTRSTLSLIDTSLAKPAYAKLSGLFAKTDDAVKNSKKAFADVAVAASGSPKVEFKAIEDGDYIIGGVLTDVYQRKMTSKIVNVQ